MYYVLLTTRAARYPMRDRKVAAIKFYRDGKSPLPNLVDVKRMVEAGPQFISIQETPNEKYPNTDGDWKRYTRHEVINGIAGGRYRDEPVPPDYKPWAIVIAAFGNFTK